MGKDCREVEAKARRILTNDNDEFGNYCGALLFIGRRDEMDHLVRSLHFYSPTADLLSASEVSV